MLYSFTLHDTANGTTVVYNDSYDYEDERLMLFQWLQNNYNCDCNRRAFMYNDDETDYECGEEVILLKIVDADGRIVYEKDRR